MQTMTEFLQTLRNNGGKIGQVLKRFNSVLRMTQASAGNATAACVSAGACAAYQAKLSRENFMELAGHIYDAEKGPRVPNKGLEPLVSKLPPSETAQRVYDAWIAWTKATPDGDVYRDLFLRLCKADPTHEDLENARGAP